MSEAEIMNLNSFFEALSSETLDAIVKDLFFRSKDMNGENDGLIPFRIQKQLVEIFKTLDKIGVFHGDPNPTNFMKKGGVHYFGEDSSVNGLSLELSTFTPEIDSRSGKILHQ